MDHGYKYFVLKYSMIRRGKLNDKAELAVFVQSRRADIFPRENLRSGDNHKAGYTRGGEKDRQTPMQLLNKSGHDFMLRNLKEVSVIHSFSFFRL